MPSLNGLSTVVWPCIIHVGAVINNERARRREKKKQKTPITAQDSFSPSHFSGFLTTRRCHSVPSSERLLPRCSNKVPIRRDIKDLRDKTGEMGWGGGRRGGESTEAGLCLWKIKALQSGRMMDGWESFIHQCLFTSPLSRPSLRLPALPLKGQAAWF